MNVKGQRYNQERGEGRRHSRFLKNHAMHTSALCNKLNKDSNNFDEKQHFVSGILDL